MQLQPSISMRPANAAQLLDISRATFWRYATRPDFPKARKLSQRCTVFDRAELIAWRDAQAVERRAA